MIIKNINANKSLRQMNGYKLIHKSTEPIHLQINLAPIIRFTKFQYNHNFIVKEEFLLLEP
jgi:hypothetical protein